MSTQNLWSKFSFHFFMCYNVQNKHTRIRAIVKHCGKWKGENNIAAKYQDGKNAQSKNKICVHVQVYSHPFTIRYSAVVVVALVRIWCMVGQKNIRKRQLARAAGNNIFSADALTQFHCVHRRRRMQSVLVVRPYGRQMLFPILVHGACCCGWGSTIPRPT